MLRIIRNNQPPKSLRRPPPLKDLKKLLQPHEVIQAALLTTGKTRRQIAEETGMSRSMVDAVVSGRRTAADFEPNIEKALGIPAGRLQELNQALVFQAQKRWGDVLQRIREETAPLARASFAEERRARFQVHENC